MKKIFTMLLLAVCVNVAAQEVIPYAMTKENASATYALLMGSEKKLMTMGVSYYKISVHSVTPAENGAKTIMYRYDFLNKKKKRSSVSAISGAKEGYFSQIVLQPDGSYKMDQDYAYGFGQKMARGGFMFNIPAEMAVGQTLESGTVRQECVFMGTKISTKYTYSDVKVEREEDYETAAGTYHCMVVTANLSGTFNDQTINKKIIIWFSKEVGIVCYGYDMSGSPVYIELCEVEGLK